jgi:hypothetical protein
MGETCSVCQRDVSTDDGTIYRLAVPDGRRFEEIAEQRKAGVSIAELGRQGFTLEVVCSRCQITPTETKDALDG